MVHAGLNLQRVLGGILVGFVRRQNHSSGAHAPDEYYVIESTNPKVQGFDGAIWSFVEYLNELATVA